MYIQLSLADTIQVDTYVFLGIHTLINVCIIIIIKNINVCIRKYYVDLRPNICQSEYAFELVSAMQAVALMRETPLPKLQLHLCHLDMHVHFSN